MAGPLKNPKREAFAREVGAGIPVRQAYVNAGYNAESNNAYKLLHQPDVQARIAEHTAEWNRALSVHRNYLLEKALAIVGADITQVYDITPGGRLKLKDLSKLPSELRSAVAEVTSTDRGRVGAKLFDRVRALEVAAKITGAFSPQKIEVDGKIPIEVQAILGNLSALPEPERQKKLATMVALSSPGDLGSENDIARMVALTLRLGGVGSLTGDDGGTKSIEIISPSATEVPAAERAKRALLTVVDVAEALRGNDHVAPAFAARLRQVADVLDAGGATS